MWAVGVIFADMLARRPLLHSKSVKELLTKQVALVGKPDDATIERVATPNFNRQHKHFLLRMEPPAEPYDLSKLFSTPANDAEKSLWAAGLDLLKKLLVFDPEKSVSQSVRISGLWGDWRGVGCFQRKDTHGQWLID